MDGGVFAADLALGIDGLLTRQARRIVTLAGVEHSFACAQHLISELCGWQIDDEVIRRTTHSQARQAQAGRASQSGAKAFAKEGPIEVHLDAGKVNTLEGWRDVKVGLLLAREAGKPATPEQWDDRELPKPLTRVTIAAIEGCEAFGHRIRAETDRLKVTTAADVSVLGDGAEWLWNLADEHLPQAEGVLDVYHAVEHISDAVKAVWGEAESNTQRIAAGRQALLANGKSGLDHWLAGLFELVPAGSSTDPLISLAAYFAKHPTRVGYARRLEEGRSIGSGAVEGAIKQNLNLRMKRTGARWRVEHVGPLVELRALSHTPEWAALWTTPA